MFVSSKSNEMGPWLQIDAGGPVVLGALQTQGRRDALEWVSSYAISTSLDGKVFEEFQQDGALKIFPGNRDKNTIVTNEVTTSSKVRYVRFYPKAWVTQVAMRAGLLVCFSGVKFQLPTE